MEIFEGLGLGFSAIFSFTTLLIIAGGVAGGILIGVLPGLSPSIGVALMLPVSFYLSPINGIAFLVSVYLAANYGGSITAILLNTPGTPGAVATTFDGYPLTQQGKPGKALGVSLTASTMGGIVGTLILIFLSLPIARLALKFTSYETFALAVFGLTVISTLSADSPLKGFIASLFGLLLATIGLDPRLPFARFTMGIESLADGIPLIPALIGLFALGEIFFRIEKKDESLTAAGGFSREMPGPKELWALKTTMVKSSLLGAFIGAIPGAGGTIASFIAYGEAKRSSKNKANFGKGALEGVAAPESSNNASVGGALIPLLTLGIPGSASTAVLLGALMVHRIAPGAGLFKPVAEGGNPTLVYGVFASLLVANVVMFLLGLGGNRLWVRIISTPRALLFPVIIALASVGSYAVNFSMFDVALTYVFGFIGWQMKKHGYPTAPVILGLILGRMIEENLRLSLEKGSVWVFFTRPISLGLLLLTILSFLWPMIRGKLSFSRKNRMSGGETK